MKKNAFYGNGTRCPTKFSDKIFDFSGFAADDVFNDWRSSWDIGDMESNPAADNRRDAEI